MQGSDLMNEKDTTHSGIGMKHQDLSQGLCFVNRSWKIVKLNKAAQKILSFNGDKIFWSIFPTIFDYSYSGRFLESMNAMGFVSFDAYHQTLRSWFHIKIYPHDDGLLICFKDSPRKVGLQHPSRQHHERYQALLEQSKDGFLLISTDYEILGFNKSIKRFIVKYWSQMVKEGDIVLDYVQNEHLKEFFIDFENCKKGQIVLKQKKIESKSHHPHWYQIKYTPIYDEAQKMQSIALNFTDIDEQIKDKAKIARLTQNLHEIAHYQSHTIRRPVTSILGLVELIKEEELEKKSMKLIELLAQVTLELDEVIHKIVEKTYKID